jgi:hypothetical protein
MPFTSHIYSLITLQNVGIPKDNLWKYDTHVSQDHLEILDSVLWRNYIPVELCKIIGEYFGYGNEAYKIIKRMVEYVFRIQTTRLQTGRIPLPFPAINLTPKNFTAFLNHTFVMRINKQSLFTDIGMSDRQYTVVVDPHLFYKMYRELEPEFVPPVREIYAPLMLLPPPIQLPFSSGLYIDL